MKRKTSGKEKARPTIIKPRMTPPIVSWLKAILERSDDPEVVAVFGKPFHPDGLIAHYREEAIVRAIAGEPEAVREMLTAFTYAVQATAADSWAGPIRRSEALFLAAAFAKILGGVEPSRALGLKQRSSGRPSTAATERKYQAIASAVELLKRGGLTEERAIAQLDANGGVSKRTIHRARRANPWVERQDTYDARLLDVLAISFAPQIKKILGNKGGR